MLPTSSSLLCCVYILFACGRKLFKETDVVLEKEAYIDVYKRQHCSRVCGFNFGWSGLSGKGADEPRVGKFSIESVDVARGTFTGDSERVSELSLIHIFILHNTLIGFATAPPNIPECKSAFGPVTSTCQ